VMSQKTSPKKKRGPPRGLLVAFGALGVLGLGLWVLSENIAGVNLNDPPASQVNLLPPPPPAPPPPPPPKEKPPEPDKAIVPPKPDAQAKSDESKQLTIAGPAQAGGDAFGIKAGSGGGSSLIGGPGNGAGNGGGGGFAEASWGRYLSSEIQQKVQSDDQVNRRIFAAVVAVWVDAGGRLTKAVLMKSSGDSKLDRQLVASLEDIGSVGEPPPASFRFPQRVAIQGKRGA
jgi:periplasmic protein TonB